MTVSGGKVSRGISILVPESWVSPVFQEHLNNVELPFGRGMHQGRKLLIRVDRIYFRTLIK